MFLNRKLVVKYDFQELLYIWLPKALAKDTLHQKSVAGSITFLIKNWYFTIENMVLKQDIGTLMGTDSALSLPVSLFLGKPVSLSFLFFVFLSLSMFQIMLLKNQLEHINTMLLFDSQMTFAQWMIRVRSPNPLDVYIQEN